MGAFQSVAVQFVNFSVCGRFSLWPSRSEAVAVLAFLVCVSVCERSSLWPFRFVVF